MDIKGHNVSSSIVSTGIIFSLYLLLNEKFFLKVIKWLNWNFNLNLNTNMDISIIYKLFPLFDFNEVKLFNYQMDFFSISIFFITLLVYFGGVFPDTDQTYLKPLKYSLQARRNRKEFGEEEGKKKNAYLYQKYHRQCTHSPLHFVITAGIILYFNYVEKNNLLLFFYYFEIGVLTHLIADIFVGSGGIPKVCYGQWNHRQHRISFKILENNNVVTKGLVYIHFVVLSLITIISWDYRFLILLLLYSYFIQIKTAKMVFLQIFLFLLALMSIVVFL